MANLTYTEKGKIISLLLKNEKVDDIAIKTGITPPRVDNFLKSVMEYLTKDAALLEYDFPSVVLRLITEGVPEKDAYYYVYSVALEESYDSMEQFEELLAKKKSQAMLDRGMHDNRVSRMTEELSQIEIKADPNDVYDLPYIFRSHGS